MSSENLINFKDILFEFNNIIETINLIKKTEFYKYDDYIKLKNNIINLKALYEKKYLNIILI